MDCITQQSIHLTLFNFAIFIFYELRIYNSFLFLSFFFLSFFTKLHIYSVFGPFEQQDALKDALYCQAFQYLKIQMNV